MTAQSNSNNSNSQEKKAEVISYPDANKDFSPLSLRATFPEPATNSEGRFKRVDIKIKLDLTQIPEQGSKASFTKYTHSKTGQALNIGGDVEVDLGNSEYNLLLCGSYDPSSEILTLQGY